MQRQSQPSQEVQLSQEVKDALEKLGNTIAVVITVLAYEKKNGDILGKLLRYKDFSAADKARLRQLVDLILVMSTQSIPSDAMAEELTNSILYCLSIPK